jgi:hypothetical protein
VRTFEQNDLDLLLAPHAAQRQQLKVNEEVADFKQG